MFLASQEALRTIEQNLTNQALLSRVVRSEALAADGGKAIPRTAVMDKQASPPPNTERPQSGAKAEGASGGTTFTPLEKDWAAQ